MNKRERIELDRLLTDIIEGTVTFDDFLLQGDLQARIDKAISMAKNTPNPKLFARGYILCSCKRDLEEIAIFDARPGARH